VSRFHSYLNSAVTLLQQYKGEEPFAAYLKKHFAANKKYGSKDRKQIAHCCYCYFRAAHLLKDRSLDEQVLAAVFLCSAVPDPVITALRPEWQDQHSLSAEEKLNLLNVKATLLNLFPWNNALTEGIDPVPFAASFLQQPDVFIRIRPGYSNALRSLFRSKDIFFTELSETCFAFASGTKLDEYLSTNREAVIQDYNSQQVGELMDPVKQTDWVDVWDACAASGGKSIMAKDRLGKIRLTVSDVRESILHNLKKRFSEAGIGNFQTLVADLAKADPLSPGDQFDLVIADVPCSGSGTWGRTPEQLYYFKENKIADYQQLQQRILKTILPHVKPGGYLLYITCSVFRQENEEQVSFISADKSFILVRQECLKGYDKKADTMFAALLRRQL
jgi:16S rRNA (cytosine967-C5)-methyltransferase